MRTNRKLADGKTTGLRIHTSHFEGGNGLGYALGGCELYRNSSPFTAQSTTIYMQSATFTADQISS
jgi:hypothetical protein